MWNSLSSSVRDQQVPPVQISWYGGMTDSSSFSPFSQPSTSGYKLQTGQSLVGFSSQMLMYNNKKGGKRIINSTKVINVQNANCLPFVKDPGEV